MSAEQEIEARIQRIEQGLLPESGRPGQAREKATLADRMKHYHNPGVSIAVLHDYQIEWARGYGVKEAGRPDPVTTETLFQAGSISKPVAALAAMRLVEQGAIGLDEDINRYLVSWKVPANAAWQPRVTLRQLLSHSAGTTVHGFPGYAQGAPVPSLTQVLNGEEPANTAPVRVNILPGGQFRYSGGGTSIVQQMLIDVLGRPFPEIARELVLDPLGMEHSTYAQPLPEWYWSSASTAHPTNGKPLEGRWHTYPEMAAAGLWTTASDLARFALELQLIRAGKPGKTVSGATVQEMFSPQVAPGMGIGVMLDGSGTSRRFEHGGWDEGFVAKMVAYQEQGFGTVVMLNSNAGFPLLDEITRAIAAEYGWPDYLPAERPGVEVDRGVLEAYSGEYEMRPDFILKVTMQNGALSLQPTGQDPIPLLAESETKFFTKVLETEVTFHKTDDGGVKELILRQEGRELPAKRLP